MNVEIIGFDEGDAILDWSGVADAIRAGHTLPNAEIGDTFLYRGTDTLLSRAAWIDGLGQAVKTATIFPNNEGPSVNGAVTMFSDETGELEALIDFHLVTKWKTAGDSYYAAKLLGGTPERALIVGNGTVAANMVQVYRDLWPDIEITVWGRNRASSEAFAASVGGKAVDLEVGVKNAQIICTATMTTEPLIQGAWLQPGQHLDLIGAYRPDMREVDDLALQRACVFVDSFATTLGHIGELKIPLEAGTITRDHVLADYYDPDALVRRPDDITICKNGGGAHLDLMVCRHILERWSAR